MARKRSKKARSTKKARRPASKKRSSAKRRASSARPIVIVIASGGTRAKRSPARKTARKSTRRGY